MKHEKARNHGIKVAEDDDVTPAVSQVLAVEVWLRHGARAKIECRRHERISTGQTTGIYACGFTAAIYAVGSRSIVFMYPMAIRPKYPCIPQVDRWNWAKNVTMRTRRIVHHLCYVRAAIQFRYGGMRVSVTLGNHWDWHLL